LVFLAVGMVVGALLVPKLANYLKLQALFLGGVTGFGLAMIGFALSGTFAVLGFFTAMAGLCLAAVTVAGNTYVAQTVGDEIRGRVFTALESVIRVSLLLSMIVVAPLGDVVAGVVFAVVSLQGGDMAAAALTGPRITLIMAATVVLGAAYYALRRLNWRSESME
jgi:MFS family permease